MPARRSEIRRCNSPATLGSVAAFCDNQVTIRNSRLCQRLATARLVQRGTGDRTVNPVLTRPIGVHATTVSILTLGPLAGLERRHRPAAPTHANAGRTRPPDCDAVPRGRSFGAYSGGSAPGLSDRAIAGRVAALSSDEQRQAEHKPDDLARLLRLGQGGRRVSGEILDVCTPCRG